MAAPAHPEKGKADQDSDSSRLVARPGRGDVDSWDEARDPRRGGRSSMSRGETTAISRSKGRIADHLANERTFLAWIRTALGLIGLGFVLARMGLFLRNLAMAG